MKVIKSKLSSLRKRITNEQHGPATTFSLLITKDYTGEIIEIPYRFKKSIVTKLKDYTKISKDIFIGKDNFAVIIKNSWR